MTADSTTEVDVGIACEAIAIWMSRVVVVAKFCTVSKGSDVRLEYSEKSRVCTKLRRICSQVGCFIYVDGNHEVSGASGIISVGQGANDQAHSQQYFDKLSFSNYLAE